MRKLCTAISIAMIMGLTILSSECMTTVEKKLTYPKQITVDHNKNLIYPIKNYNKSKEIIIFTDWLRWVEVCSKKYGVDKHFALAVAECESSNRYARFRFGKMGRGTFYGPYGIKNIFMRKWRIDDAFVNTEVGIRALGRYSNQKRSLKKYNTSFNMAYYKRIKYLERKNREEKIFDQKNPELMMYKLR